MNNISNQFPPMGATNRQKNLPDFHSATFTKEQSLNTRESLDTGLVIQTKDGDQVTLTSNSYSRMDAFMYNSKGVVQTDSGTAAFSESRREITLASGQSFTFSVEGDLSEEELQDIDAMLKGLDGVISEMTSGDMEGAVEKALGLGEFDTFSSFAADISYQRSYQMTSSTTATMAQSLPTEKNASENNSSTPASLTSPNNHNIQGKNNTGTFDVDTFFNKIMKQLDAHEDKQVGLAKNPIDKLFKHHLGEINKAEEGAEAISSAIEQAMDRVDSLITEMMSNMFENELSAQSEE